MSRILLSLAAFVLTLTNAQASVVINETNFPDENLRNYASQYDEDGNGTLSDAELATITSINAGGILNLKGASSGAIRKRKALRRLTPVCSPNSIVSP